jgi:serine/threonine protein kinase
MAQYFHQILIGKKLLEGKVLPASYEVSTPNAILIENFLAIQRGGEIFQARFAGGNRAFLLKIPAPPLEETNKYIQNEITVLEKLAKPGVLQIPVIQKSSLAGSQKSLPFYVSQLVASYNMRFPELLQRKAINHVEAMKIFYLLAKALEYLAAYQIVHSDIHPDTVQFYDHMPMITHFGAAKNWRETWSEISSLAAKYGDPLWLPPEVFTIELAQDGAPEVVFHPEEFGDKTDVWALGLLLAYYLTGTKIFEDISLDGGINGVLQNIPSISQKQMVARYRNRCKLFLEQNYLTFASAMDETQFINEIGELCWAEHENEASLGAIDRDQMVRFGIDNLMTTRKKMIAQSRQKSKFLKEFYVQILVALFDMCIAPAKLRANGKQLVVVLNCLLPGLARQANFLQCQPYVPQFQDTATSTSVTPSSLTVDKATTIPVATAGPVGQGNSLLRPQTFRAGTRTASPAPMGSLAQPASHTPGTVFERPRAQLRHSMKTANSPEIQSLIQQERHRYFGKTKEEEKPQ